MPRLSVECRDEQGNSVSMRVLPLLRSNQSESPVSLETLNLLSPLVRVPAGVRSDRWNSDARLARRTRLNATHKGSSQVAEAPQLSQQHGTSRCYTGVSYV